jgi:hypothetical protein
MDNLAQRTRLRCGLLLGSVGLLALKIGIEDIGDVESFSVRLLALFFVIVGGFLLISAIGLIRRASWGPPSALVACVLSAAIGLILIIVQAVGYEHDYHYLLWLVILLISLFYARLLLRSGTDPAVLKRMPALLSAVGIAGLLPFWYSQLYVPSTPEPTLTITNELTREGVITVDKAKGTEMLAIKATMLFKNGDSRLRQISVLYKAVGQRMSPNPKGPSSGELRNRLKTDETTFHFATHLESKLIAARAFLNTSGWIGPREEFRRSFVFYVPKGVFDKLVFTTQLWTGNSRRFKIGEACNNNGRKTTPTDEEDFRTQSGEISESSFLNNLTRDKRCVYSRLAQNRTEGPSSLHLHVHIAKANSASPGGSRSSMARVYGVFDTTSVTELSLWDEENSEAAAKKRTQT